MKNLIKSITRGWWISRVTGKKNFTMYACPWFYLIKTKDKNRIEIGDYK